jgi:hypothetical protein
MLDATHPGTYSIYWNAQALSRLPRLNVLRISLAMLAVTAIGSGVSVASQFSHLPSPEEVAVIPPGAEGMNMYPVTETAEVWLAPHATAN